jgi:hypothetical protein
LLQEKIGGFKDLLKKLNQIQNFKNSTINELISENEKIIKKNINEISRDIEKLIEKTLKIKTKKIDESLNYIHNKEENIKILLQHNEKQINDISFLMEHNNLLMMKLANKGILSQREINEMSIRASKK